ncbi:MAG: M23 family metallopeptidase [Patescibacteria group bacterium]
MKKVLLITIILLIAVAIFFLTKDTAVEDINQAIETNANLSVNLPLPVNESITVDDTGEFSPPLIRTKERVTKKEFGDYITPGTSPVQPERFQGYHTGTDFEIFTEELDSDVSVHAICTGQLLLKQQSNGYGGVVIQKCQLEGESITITYGHLRLSSVEWALDEEITKGQTIGVLGANLSSETDGERKHLHLALHQGTDLNIRGYVSSQAELDNWLDPCLYVCQ